MRLLSLSEKVEAMEENFLEDRKLIYRNFIILLRNKSI